jgi:2-polyprenyl-3-methyl-5-hydroxy-6-metoxy-1,4-benzoquinol methylase
MTTSMRTGPASADPYARIADLDDTTVAALAGRLDLRASDSGQHALWDAFLARIPDAAGRVLDVGCGTGILTEKIARRVADGQRDGGGPRSSGRLAA